MRTENKANKPKVGQTATIPSVEKWIRLQQFLRLKVDQAVAIPASRLTSG